MITPPGKNDPRSKIVIYGSLVLMVALVVFVLLDLDRIKALIGSSGYWGLLVAVIVYGLLGLTLVPSEPLTILVGALFGPWIATVVAGVGNILAAIAEYYVGTRIGVATNFIQQKEKLPFGLGKLKVESPLFLIGGRMAPGYGTKVVSLLAGIYHVPLIRFIWTAAIPNFLGAAVLAFGGFGLGKLF